MLSLELMGRSLGIWQHNFAAPACSDVFTVARECCGYHACRSAMGRDMVPLSAHHTNPSIIVIGRGVLGHQYSVEGIEAQNKQAEEGTFFSKGGGRIK